MFFPSRVASVLFYAVLCWVQSIMKKDYKQLNKLIKQAGTVVGFELVPLITVAEKGLLANYTNPQYTLY